MFLSRSTHCLTICPFTFGFSSSCPNTMEQTAYHSYPNCESIFGPVGTREPSPTALALGFNVSRIYFACCNYAGNLYPAYLQHAFVYRIMRPKAKAIGLVSIVPVGRKDIYYYTNSELVRICCMNILNSKIVEKQYPLFGVKSDKMIAFRQFYLHANFSHFTR